jgi:hypothetical protein
MLTSIPDLVEAVWSRAEPGRESACQNELLRQLRELLTAREPPRWFRNMRKEKARL